MPRRFALVLALLLGLSTTGLAAASVVLTDASSGMPLNAHIELLEDDQGTLAIDDLAAPEQQSRFQPANGRASVGQSLNPWWIKLTLQRDMCAPAYWVLEVGSVTQLDLQLYLPDGQGGWQLRQSGERVPFSENRDHPYRRMVFDLPTLGEQPKTLYLRAFDPAGNSFPLRVWQLEDLTQLATRENLARAARTLAERSGPEDLVFIYLTSHGSRHHELNLDQPRLQLADLPASELAALLAPLKQRNKVVVICACYSGGFIPPLKDEKTLVMTAARADRVSFGCSEENDFTYFGRALFAEALGETDNLERAFELARERVAEREQSDGFEPSEPQIWAPRGVLQHWRELRQSQAERALGAVASGPAKD